MPQPFTLVQTRPTGHTRARGVVSDPLSATRIQVATYAPPAPLADLVASYWTGRWDLEDRGPHVSELLSDPCVNLAFERGTHHAGARLVGVWTKLWRRTLEGRGVVRAVKLRAGAVRAFVQQPADRFTNRIVPLDTLFGSEVASLERAVLDPTDDMRGFRTLHEWLLARRQDHLDPNVSLAIALVQRVGAQPDLTSVDQLSQVAGMGKRSLQRLFKEYVGSTPKAVIRRNRLQEAALRIEQGEKATLTAIAADLGYTDHAHLARDFRNAVGKSPSAFAASLRRAGGLGDER